MKAYKPIDFRGVMMYNIGVSLESVKKQKAQGTWYILGNLMNQDKDGR